ASEVRAHSGCSALARFRRRLQSPADFPRVPAPSDGGGLQRRTLQRGGPDLVGPQHGRLTPAHIVGCRVAQRAASCPLAQDRLLPSSTSKRNGLAFTAGMAPAAPKCYAAR